MNNEVLLSHKSDEWQTPKPFFDLLDDEFHFDLDPCAYTDPSGLTNIKEIFTEFYYNKRFDGLKHNWYYKGKKDMGVNTNCKNVFINPPFSIEDEFILKAYKESLKGCNCVLLIYSKTDKAIWHDIIFPFAIQIRFIRGRINFVGGNSTSTKGLTVVIFSESLIYKDKIVYYDKSINRYLKDKNKKLIKNEIKELLNG